MSPETPKIIIGEIGRGEELLRTTVDCARQALVDTYPILAKDPYEQKLPSFEKVMFVTPETISGQERLDRDIKRNYSAQFLLASGASQKSIEEFYFPINNEIYDLSPDEHIVLVDEFISETMDNANNEARTKASAYLGQLLIQHFLESSPVKRSLPIYPWKEITKNGMNFLIGLLEKTSKSKFNEFVLPSILALFDQDAKFFAQGATIKAYLPNQGYENPEFRAGISFDTGIVNLLARDVRAKFFQLLSTRYTMSPRIDRAERSQESIKARALLNGTPPFSSIGNDELIKYYLESQIPLYVQNNAAGNVYKFVYPY